MTAWPICWPHAWLTAVAILPDDLIDYLVTFDGHELNTVVELPKCNNPRHRDRDRIAYVYKHDHLWRSVARDESGAFELGDYRSKGDAISAALCMIWQCRHTGWVGRYPDNEPTWRFFSAVDGCRCPIEPPTFEDRIEEFFSR